MNATKEAASTMDLLTQRLTRFSDTRTDFNDLTTGRNALTVPSFAEVEHMSAKAINKQFNFFQLSNIQVPIAVEAVFRAVEDEWCMKEFGEGANFRKSRNSFALHSFISLLGNGINVFTGWERHGKRKMLTVAGVVGNDPGYKEHKPNANPGMVKNGVTMQLLRTPSAAWDNSEDGGPAYYRTPGTKSGKGVVKRASKKRTEALKALMAAHTDLMFFFRRPAGSENLDNLSSAGCTDMMRRLNNLIADSQKMPNTSIPQQKTNERNSNMISDAQKNYIYSLASQKGQTERYTEDFVSAMTKREASATIERLNAMSSVAPVIGVGKYNLNGDTVEVVQNKTKTGYYCYVNGTYASNSREIIASLTPDMRIADSQVIATPTKYKPEEGMYIDRITGQIYRAKISRETGNLYGMRWELFDSPEPTKRGMKFGEFIYDRSVMSRLTADMRMSYEEACALGTQFHFCIRCGIELIQPSSIARGMGDTCAEKF